MIFMIHSNKVLSEMVFSHIRVCCNASGAGEELHFGMYNKEVSRRKFNYITIDGLNYQSVIHYLLD